VIREVLLHRAVSHFRRRGIPQSPSNNSTFWQLTEIN
jgi:hypothetical protein